MLLSIAVIAERTLETNYFHVRGQRCARSKKGPGKLNVLGHDSELSSTRVRINQFLIKMLFCGKILARKEGSFSSKFSWARREFSQCPSGPSRPCTWLLSLLTNVILS